MNKIKQQMIADRKDKFAKLVEQYQKDHAGEYVDFGGNNCYDIDDNECKGWDMVSRRCECGNRRVAFEMDDDETYVWPEAW